MADYWKSNPKKYCDLCKCWIADNKISIQNHENGMRHKASVAKKVNELTRSNNDAEVEKRKLEACLQQINDSAHLSMMKDLERDPSLAKQYGIELAKEIKANHTEESLSKTEKSLPAVKSRLDPPKPENIWRESITPDGKHYYWNIATRMTQWTRPDGIIEPDNRTVKQEKDRLKDFVFNRLVELSESGSKGANEAVLQAFNASVDEDISIPTVVEKPTVDRHHNDERPSTPEPKKPIEFHGPRIDLLGPWVACEDVPTKPKLPKLDLPIITNDVVYSQNPVLNEKLSVIAHLEEATEKSIENTSLFNPVEKVIHPGSCLGGGGSSIKKSEDNGCKVEQSSSSNPARIVFRRRPPGSNRSIRAPQNDD